MITTSQFQERLIEYLDGELPEAERREVEEYLRAHPEAARLEGDLALLSEAGRSIRESSYPADLLLEANRALAARLAARSPVKRLRRGERYRPSPPTVRQRSRARARRRTAGVGVRAPLPPPSPARRSCSPGPPARGQRSPRSPAASCSESG